MLAQNHVTFESQNHLRQIISPLANEGIAYFSYGVNYHDKRSIHLSTHADYFQNTLVNEYPLMGYLLGTGWHTWGSCLPEKQQAEAEEHRIANGVLYVNHQHDKTEIIEFAADINKKNPYDFYLNNLPLLKKFIGHFKQTAKEVIHTAQQQAFLPPLSMIKETDVTAQKRPVLLEMDTPINHLSNRELSCYQYLIKGYSIANISKELNLAIPTIANYIARIKHKLQCANRKDMIALAELYGYIDMV